jgi:CBS domain-containing protein
LTRPSDATVADVARAMLEHGSAAVAIVDAERVPLGVVTVDRVLSWVAAGGGAAATPVRDLCLAPAAAVEPSASLADAVLAIARSEDDAVVMTSDGTPRSAVHAIITAVETAHAFGDQPNHILSDIRRAGTIEALRTLNHRARALILRQAATTESLDWLTQFAGLVDARILERVLRLCGWQGGQGCWCCIGAAGRGESLTRHAPQLVLLTEGSADGAQSLALYERVYDALTACDYMQRTDISYDRAFHVASVDDWISRYRQWLGDPVRSSMYLARQMFDLRMLHGNSALWQHVTAAATAAIDGDFLQVLANDCLANLPPLTFFQDAVVEKSGEQTTVFRLEESALRPLVDVGRVFGMAGRNVFGTSTLERLARARTLLPEHELIFREAADTMRILLWQQARIGIDQNTTGSELPPSLLSRHDRHVLKGGFRSILRLVEFTGPSAWFASI